MNMMFYGRTNLVFTTKNSTFYSMKVSISIDKKIIDNVKTFCKLNKRHYLDYITSAIEERLALDMYGDLNEKIKTKIEPKVKKAEDFIKEHIQSMDVNPSKSDTKTVKIEETKVDRPKDMIQDTTVQTVKKTTRRILNSK